MIKYRLIKILAALAAVSVLAASFTGCDKNSSGTAGDDKETPSVTEIIKKQTDNARTFSATYLAPEHSFENIKSVETNGDKVYIFEQMNDVIEKEVSVMVSASSKETVDFSLDAAGYSYIQFAAMGEKSLAVIYSDEANAQHICVFDRETGSVLSDIQAADNTYISNIRSDSAGNFTVVKSVYGENGTKIHMEWYNGETLESLRDENITDTLQIPDSAAVIDVFADSEGAAYVFAVDYPEYLVTVPYLYKIDADGKSVYSRSDFEDWSENFSGMYLSESGTVCLCTTSDYAEYSIYELDPKTAATIEIHDISIPKFANFSGGMTVPGYDFAYISSSGVTGCSFETGESEVILEFGKDLDPSLKNSFTMASCGDMIYLYSLSNEESNRRVTVTDFDGKELMSADLPAEKGYVSQFCSDENGIMYYSETYDPGASVETASGYNMAYIFHVIDENGNAKKSFIIDAADAYGDASIQRMCAGSDGNLYMLFQTFSAEGVTTEVFVTDNGGNLITEIHSIDDNLIVTDIYTGADGKVKAVCLDADGNNILADVNVSGRKLDRILSIVLEGEASVISGKGKYDIYWLLDNRVYAYSTDDNAEVCLADAEEYISVISCAVADSDDRMLFSTYDQETGETGVLELTAD